MARNRMIKPEFFTDDALCSIPIEASHLFSGIWCFADDYGAIDYSERAIMGDIYRKRTSLKWKKVQNWIQDLINIGSLIKCSYHAVDYLVVTNWDEHQIINRPSQRTYLEKSISCKVRLTYKEMSGSGKNECTIPEQFLTVSLMKEKENKKEKENVKGSHEFIAPSLDDVKEYFKENGYPESLASQFYNGYSIANWKDSRGNPILNWKQKAIQVWFKPDQKNQPVQTQSRYKEI